MTAGQPAARSVLVTGAYGLLGSWLVGQLLGRGDRVTVLRRDAVAVSALLTEGWEREVCVVTGEVTDIALLERVLAQYAVQTVFHLAAQTIVGVAARAPLATFETNVRGTWCLLEACRRVGVGQILVASSDKAYGTHADLPYTEDHALLARYPYDVSKAAADMIARSYWHTYAMPVAVTRCANLYGGGDLNLSRLVPEAALAAIDGRAPVIRSDGTPQRDFLYVQDAVAAYLAISELLATGSGGGESFNAGGDEPHSVLDVVTLTCRVAGATVTPEVRGNGAGAGEIDRQWLDSSKLRRLTGWAPRVALEEGLAETVDWYRHHRGQLPVTG